MHDIWNPWHGCVKCSEGCAHCYMYFLDSQRGHNGAEIYRVQQTMEIIARSRQLQSKKRRAAARVHDVRFLFGAGRPVAA